jgi:radical SAM superfamily enzyme YgiQ (UPF0313 family)
MNTTASVLLVNPWVMDFAAYNLWAEPLGLLYLASLMKKAQARIDYINCLYSMERPNPQPKQNGCSKYLRTVIQKPESLSFVKRSFARYGMTEEEFVHQLRCIRTPDVVLISSMMTYWYPGVFRAIELIKRVYGNRAPVILGGIYARLCTEHAKKYSGADHIYTESGFASLFDLVERLSGKILKLDHLPADFSEYPLPLHELQGGTDFFAVLTRQGCPYRCSYCASSILCKEVSVRPHVSVLSEIQKYTSRLNTKNIALYDDALLVDSDRHLKPLLEKIVANCLGLSLHLPNGIHSRLVSPKSARLLHKAGVKTIRTGLETANSELQTSTGNKITNEDYTRSLNFLKEAGFQTNQIGTYIMAGLPGQTPQDVEDSIKFVEKSGGYPYISSFSPIPGTAIWNEAVRSSPFPIQEDPLFHNNTVFILGNRLFPEHTLQYLKDMAVGVRKSEKT